VTNSAGIASVTATANSSIGTYLVTASAGTFSASFTRTNSAFSSCDVNQDGQTNVLDVQQMVKEALGTARALNDLNSDGTVNLT
jgi:hypothetical protein